MTCKFDIDMSYYTSDLKFIRQFYCEKYGDTTQIICTPKTQPNCYEKEIICNHESHFISSMERCEKCGDDRE